MNQLYDLAKSRFSETSQNYALLTNLVPQIVSIAVSISDRLRGGGKVMLCGNGGSAADCQHFAAELMGRFMRERQPYAAMSLTTDTSLITAIGNDYGFDNLFERQVRGLGRPSDVLIGISTSGRSPNVLRALRAGKEMGMLVIGLFGNGQHEETLIYDYLLRVPATSTPRIQEMHLGIEHLICELVEQELS